MCFVLCFLGLNLLNEDNFEVVLLKLIPHNFFLLVVISFFWLIRIGKIIGLSRWIFFFCFSVFKITKDFKTFVFKCSTASQKAQEKKKFKIFSKSIKGLSIFFQQVGQRRNNNQEHNNSKKKAFISVNLIILKNQKEVVSHISRKILEKKNQK